jgi:hypothetical protein
MLAQTPQRARQAQVLEPVLERALVLAPEQARVPVLVLGLHRQ